MEWFWIPGIALGICFCVLVAVLLRGYGLQRVEREISVPNLPKSFDGFRIALISDLHDRRFPRQNLLLAERVLDASPDLVVIAGDLHEGKHDPEPVYRLLSALGKHVLTTYTEGNHDLRRGRKKLSDADYEKHLSRIRETGTVLLNDTVYPIERNGQILLLAGQSWDGMGRGEVPPREPSLPSVLVCHDPLQFDRIDPLPDLMLSGHVHGGILRLPFVGALFAPGNGAPLYKRFGRKYFLPKYSRGLYFKGSHTLAVTQGLGFSVAPIRFIPAEILVLTLKSGEKMNNS